MVIQINASFSRLVLVPTRYILSIAVLLGIYAFQCESEVEIRDDVRTLVRGRVQDHLGNDLMDIPVSIYAGNDYYTGVEYSLPLSSDVLMGKGFTGADGRFEIVSLQPSNYTSFYALINWDAASSRFAPPFGRLIILDLDQGPINDFTYDLGLRQLDVIKQLDFTINRSINATDTLQYVLRHASLDDTFSYSPSTQNWNVDLFSEITKAGSLNPNEFLGIETLRIRETDTLFFDYTLKNRVVLDSDTLFFVIDNQTSNLEFSF